MESLLIVDDIQPKISIVGAHNHVVNYSGSDENSLGDLNLLFELQNNDRALKAKFLRFIHNVGKAKIDGVSVEDHLEVSPGVSYWWQTLIAEKSPFKTTFIYDYYKFQCIRNYILSRDIESVTICTTRPELIALYGQLKLDVSVISKRSFRSLGDRVKSSFFLSALYFCYKFLSERRFYKSYPVQTKNKIVVAYFPHYIIEKGQFENKFFGGLSQLLTDHGYTWIFIPQGRISARLPEIGLSHTFLNCFIDIATFCKAVRSAWEYRIAFRKIGVPTAFNEDEVCMFSLFRKGWEHSINYNLILSCLNQAAFANLAQNEIEKCVYPMEFQPWEYSLLESFPHADTIGSIHALLKPNWMSYHYHSYDMPLPGRIGSYGPHLGLVASLPESKLVATEAQRYQYLHRIPCSMRPENSVLLITTSAIADEAIEQLNLLIASNQSSYHEFWLKPHPGLDLSRIAEQRSNLGAHQIRTEPIGELLQEVSAAYCANSSAVIMESILLGVQTFTYVSLSRLPMLVIDSHPLLYIATGAESLRLIMLEAQSQSDTGLEVSSKFVTTDPSFSLWKSII